MSELPPPIPPPLPPSDAQAPPKQDFYFHAPPEELDPALSGIGLALVVILHLAGLAALALIYSVSGVPGMPKGENVNISGVIIGMVGAFMIVCLVFMFGRVLFKHTNQNVAQPLILIACYGAVIVLPMTFGSFGDQLNQRVANSKNQEAISKLKKKTQALDRERTKNLEEDIPFAADPSDIKERKEAWEEMVANVDTKGMSETDKKIFAATQEVMGTLMEAGQKFAESSMGDLTFGGVKTREDAMATKSKVERVRAANTEMADYMKGLPDLIAETTQGHGVPKREAAAFSNQFLTTMNYEAQLKVRELEDQRMDTLTVILDLLLHHDGTWEQTDGEFLFEDDQAIEDFNVLMGEIDRIEGELVEQQEAIMNAAAKAQAGVR